MAEVEESETRALVPLAQQIPLFADDRYTAVRQWTEEIVDMEADNELGTGERLYKVREDLTTEDRAGSGDWMRYLNWLADFLDLHTRSLRKRIDRYEREVLGKQTEALEAPDPLLPDQKGPDPVRLPASIMEQLQENQTHHLRQQIAEHFPDPMEQIDVIKEIIAHPEKDGLDVVYQAHATRRREEIVQRITAEPPPQRSAGDPTGFRNVILVGDVLDVLRTVPDGIVNTLVTSPPYWGMRDYDVEGQLGSEETPEEYVAKMVAIFEEVRRVLRDDGTVWLNIGDTYTVGTQGRTDDAPPTRKYIASGWKESTGKAAEKGDDHHSRRLLPGTKPKDLLGIPWMLGMGLQGRRVLSVIELAELCQAIDDADLEWLRVWRAGQRLWDAVGRMGWYLRDDIVWHKPNPMMENVRDRPTRAHEYILLLSKSETYYYNREAIREPSKSDGAGQHFRNSARYVDQGSRVSNDDHAGDVRRATGYNPDGRNKLDVWTVSTAPFPGAHFATFPPKLIEPCILAGAPEGGLVLDPFMGAGTTALVARQNRRDYLGIELKEEYRQMAEERLVRASRGEEPEVEDATE